MRCAQALAFRSLLCNCHCLSPLWEHKCRSQEQKEKFWGYQLQSESQMPVMRHSRPHMVGTTYNRQAVGLLGAFPAVYTVGSCVCSCTPLTNNFTERSTVHHQSWSVLSCMAMQKLPWRRTAWPTICLVGDHKQPGRQSQIRVLQHVCGQLSIAAEAQGQRHAWLLQYCVYCLNPTQPWLL